MRLDWDARARENARYYVVNSQENGLTTNFRRRPEDGSGRDPDRPAQYLPRQIAGRNEDLEIGCGAGRVTRAMAELFGEVQAVDVSGEMVAISARSVRREQLNVTIHHNNGRDLGDLRDSYFDFAFSSCCFQHIPSYDVIESYMRETARVLKRRRAVQVRSAGLRCDEAQARRHLARCSIFDGAGRGLSRAMRIRGSTPVGAGTEDFWLWFFKR